MVENGSIADFFPEEAQRLFDNTLPIVRGRVDTAITEGLYSKIRGLRRSDDSEHHWMIDIDPDTYNTILRMRTDNQKVLRETEISVAVLPRKKVRLRGFLGMRPEIEVTGYEFNSQSDYEYKYGAGKRVYGYLDEDDKEHIAFLPAIETDISLSIDGDKVGLWKISQNVKINNPTVNPIKYDATIIGMSIDDKFSFSVSIASKEPVEDKIVESTFMKVFEPEVHTDGVIKFIGHDVESGVVIDMPQPFTIRVKEDEARLSKKGRERAARIARFIPNNFSWEQARQMFSNIIDGKAFTVGVIDPLELAGVRNASKKTSE